MVNMIMHGCNGAMGQVISSMVQNMEDITIVAGVDMRDNNQNKYPVFSSLADCDVKADVIVDFSAAKAVDQLLEYCFIHRMPVVLCSTGLSKEQEQRVNELAKAAAVLRSANMSLGVNLLLKLAADAAKTLAAAGFDMEIVEKHHNRKIDAPSGTALALADALNEAMDGDYHYKYDRSAAHVRRDPKEIGIQSVRGGSIVGEHDVIFAGQDEVITFSHTAYSKAIFAKGAVEAARFLAKKPAGLYSMSDVIG